MEQLSFLLGISQAFNRFQAGTAEQFWSQLQKNNVLTIREWQLDLIHTWQLSLLRREETVCHAKKNGR